MKIIFRNGVALLLVFAMIFTLGVSSFTEDIFIDDPMDILNGEEETVMGDSYGEDDFEIIDEDEIGTVIIPDSSEEGKSVTDDVYGEDIPKIGGLEYTVRYFIDSIEAPELEFTSEVPIEEPIVEDIPYYNLLEEGYILDELNSTELPFIVSEEDNVIEVYFELNPDSEGTEVLLTTFAPGSLGSAKTDRGMMRTFTSSGLEPGEVRTSKTATPVPGMVNTWDITVRIEGRDTEETEDTDVVLVIDRSGSMSRYGTVPLRRIGYAKNAAISFINRMIDQDANLRIAIVSFGDTATPLHGFSRNKATLRNAVNGIISNNEGTFTQAGILQGREYLKGSNADNKFMVLLSDGWPTYSYEPTNWSIVQRNPNSTNNRDQYTGIYDGSHSNTRRGTGIHDDGVTNSFNQNPAQNPHNNRYITKHINHGSAAIKAGIDTRAGIDGLFTIAVQTEPGGSNILRDIASPGMAFENENLDELESIYDEIGTQISTQYAIRNAVITDEMGDGFSIINGSIVKTEGITTVATATGSNNQTITWTIDPAVTTLVPGSIDVRYAEMKYRIEINDNILDIEGAKAEDHQLFETNKSTNLQYLDTDNATQNESIESPEVDPVLLKIKKILVNPNDPENRSFNVKISKDAPNAFNQTVELEPNADYVWLTTLRYEGTYNVEEISITGSGIINLEGFEISYNIDGSEGTSFQVNHINSIPRGDVAIEVRNRELGQATPDDPLIRVSKIFSGLTLAQIDQLNNFKITITSQDSTRTRDLFLGGGTRSIEVNGDIVYKWEIKDWPAGTYIVSESGEKLENYAVVTENVGEITTTAAVISWDTELWKKSDTEVDNLLQRNGISPNLVAAKLTRNRGVFVWTQTRLSASQRLAVVQAMSSHNELGLTMANGEWYSGEDDIAGNNFYFRGYRVQYNLETGILNFPQSNQWQLIVSGAYAFEGGDPADIGVKNSYTLQTTDVIIKKEVTGNFGDLTREFAFTVIVDGDSDNPIEFSLSHGESKTLEDIPANAVLTLTEVSNGYDVTVRVGGNPITPIDGKYTITLTGEGITISVTNHKDVPIDTGITFDTLPYILILVLTTAGLGVGFVRKRNIRKED